MIILITGGSGSGKSAFAEEYIAMLSQNSRKYYLATMQVYDKEGQAKIERHQKLRSGKGFITIEQPLCIHEALDKMHTMGQESTEEKTALLECMSNLVANEMFFSKTPKSCEQVAEKITREVTQLSKGLNHLVIVTNNVFEDGIIYDETTMEYIRAMGHINEKIAAMADKVVEIVVGIPVVIKEGK